MADFFRFLIAASLLMILPAAAQGPQRPTLQLMLDTGGHMALINGLVFTPDGKQIVTASDDKVIRVWDWQAGTTIRTIRGQVGPGEEGKIFALALSPDGRWLAAAGWTAAHGSRTPCCGDIRLYDFASGELRALLRGHTDAAFALAFSTDSKRLISSSADKTAIIWDVERREILHRLKGHTQDLYAVAFSPDGKRAVTASDDAIVRLWRTSDGGLIAEMKGHEGDIDRALAVRRSDGLIASGDVTGAIRLWDGDTGRYLRTLAKQSSSVGVLRFSADGKLLLSTCRANGCTSKKLQHVWDVGTGKEVVAYPKHNNIVLAAAVSPDGRLAATAGGDDRAIHIWDLATGETRKVLAGTGAPAWAVGFSADGQTVGWGRTFKGGPNQDSHISEATSPIEFQLRLPLGGREMGQPEAVGAAQVAGFIRARTTLGAYKLAHRPGGNPKRSDGVLDIAREGKAEASIERGSTTGYRHRSYSFSSDGQTVVTGGANGTLTAYDLKGKVLGEFIGHEGDVWAVAPSFDGRLLVSGSADQTVRLWNPGTRELIVTLAHGTNGEWVIWTPQGYYAGSSGAGNMLGWQINKGADRAAEYVRAVQFRERLNRPDIVARAISLASATQAVRETAGATESLVDVLARPR